MESDVQALLREAEERGYERGRREERRDVVAWLEAAAEDYMASGLRCRCKGRVDCTTALYDEAGDIKGGRHIAAGEHVQLRPTDTGASDRSGQADSQGSAKPGSDHGSWGDPHRWHDSFGERYCTVCGIEAGEWDAGLPTIDELSGTLGNLQADSGEEAREAVTLVGGERLLAHPTATCEPPCPIHSPSHHHMREWPQHWRADRRIIERICEHGVGHPDPDDRTTDTTHGCDGCCAAPVSKPRLTICTLCEGAACEEGCGPKGCEWLDAGPESHRVCVRCRGGGCLPVEDDSEERADAD